MLYLQSQPSKQYHVHHFGIFMACVLSFVSEEKGIANSIGIVTTLSVPK
jgi:hypothetical protein